MPFRVFPIEPGECGRPPQRIGLDQISRWYAQGVGCNELHDSRVSIENQFSTLSAHPAASRVLHHARTRSIPIWSLQEVSPTSARGHLIKGYSSWQVATFCSFPDPPTCPTACCGPWRWPWKTTARRSSLNSLEPV